MTYSLARHLLRCLAAREASAVVRTEGYLRRTQPALLTGAALKHDALATAAGLLAALDGHQPVVVLALPAGTPFITALLAALLGGMTAVPAALPRAGSRSGRFARIVMDSGAAAVLCCDQDHPLISDVLRQEAATARIPILSLDRLPSAVPLDEGHVCNVPSRHPAVIQYTSGSSRFPHGVAISGENIAANARLIGTYWDMNAQSVMVNWLPHFHDMGLMGGILYPLLTGAVSIQMNPLEMIQRPARWLQAISNHRATFSGGPTFAFARTLDQVRDADCEGLDLSCWQVAFCGAEPVHAAVLEKFRRRFAPCGLARAAVHACYGMAEYTLFAAGQRGDRQGLAPQEQPESSPVPDGCALVEPCLLNAETRHNILIADPQTGQPLDDGLCGEIWLRGPSKAAGYVGDPQASAAMFEARTACDPSGEGWLRTGDLGLVANGALYVTGRLKDTLIVNGRKVSAPELEWLAAAQHCDLNPMAAAAFMPDPMASGHAVLLIETRTKSVSPGLDAAKEVIFRVVLGEWGITLDDIRFLPRGYLDRTTSGKIMRAHVAAIYRANFVAA